MARLRAWPESLLLKGDCMARFGIALGGGGSRAFVHLGVLARLEEAGLAPGFVAGSSMGAVLGALYAENPDAAVCVPRAVEYFRRSSLFGGMRRAEKTDGLHARPGVLGAFARKMATASVAGVVSFRKGLRRRHPVNRAVDDLFGARGAGFEGLQLPFAANSLNLTRGAVEEHMSGALAPALKAGVAIGLVFAPYEWNGCQHADAAPLAPVPVGMCRRLGAERVLAVDICAPVERPLECYSGFDVVRRILSVQSEALHGAEIAGADSVLRVDCSDVFWGDFSRIDELVARGHAAAETVLERVRGFAEG